MYESFFGFRERPFPSAPLAAAYFPNASHEHARQQIDRCIDRAEGLAMIVGGAGTGKSLLLQVLAAKFREKFWVATLGSTSLCTRRALLQNILFELKLPYRDMEEGELRLSLIDHLQPSRECLHGLVLLIDEAHTLPLRLLEEIRLITNLVREGEPRIRLVLAGSPALEERFTSPKLESFSQRIVSRSYLQHMSATETAAYVRHQIGRVGGKPEAIFDNDALQAMFRATDGICRLINQVGDHALMLAAAGGRRRVGADGIQEAWSDLQQLPAPWNAEAAPTSSIEFGSLDETVSEPVALAERALDRVDRHLSEIDDEEFEAEEPDFHPVARRPEVEIVFPASQELFGQGFDDEEIVIDRYAAISAHALPAVAQVTSSLGQAFANEVNLASAVAPPLRIAEVQEATPTIEPKTSPPEKRTAKLVSGASPLADKFAALRKRQQIEREQQGREQADGIQPESEVAAIKFVEPEFDASSDPVYPEPGESIDQLSVVIASLEEPEEVLAPPPAPKLLKRPQFKQLFANLGRTS